jgi:hypothetical protein
MIAEAPGSGRAGPSDDFKDSHLGGEVGFQATLHERDIEREKPCLMEVMDRFYR